MRMEYMVEAVAKEIAPGKLIFLLGEGGVGKSSLAVQVANYLAQSQRVLLFSLQHEKVEVLEKYGRESDSFKVGMPTEIVRKKYKDFVQRGKVKTVVIDEVFMMSSGSSVNTRVEEWKNLIVELREMSEELDVAVFITTSISKRCEQNLSFKDELGFAVEECVDSILYIQRDKWRYEVTVVKSVANQEGNIYKFSDDIEEVLTWDKETKYWIENWMGEKVAEYEKKLLDDDWDKQFEAYEEDLRKALDKAILLAARYHAGQRDLQGENYIMHPLRLMLNAHDATTKMVSVLHDILEDTACTEDILRQEGIPESVVEDVKRLTRRKDEEYFSYISRVNQNYFCKVIKQKDIEDNLREGCPSSLEKRYRKALEILKERGPYHFHKLVKGDIDLAYSHPKEDGSIYVYCEQADRKYTFKTAMIRKNDLEVISRYGFTDEEMQEILEEIGMVEE